VVGLLLVMGAPCDPSRKLELVCGDDLSVHWHLGKGALRTRGVLYPVHDVALRA